MSFDVLTKLAFVQMRHIMYHTSVVSFRLIQFIKKNLKIHQNYFQFNFVYEQIVTKKIIKRKSFIKLLKPL